jgi:2-oxoglutarate ferredoxin oxidoreductase subunit beta
VTFGQEEQQLRAHKAQMKPLASLGHDPANQLAALDLARAYGTELYTGMFYRNPDPPPTYDALIRQRQTELQRGEPRPRARVLEAYLRS